MIVLPFAFYFGPQTIMYYKLRPMLLRPVDEPPRGWSSVPQPLTDNQVSTAPGTKLSYFEQSIEVPWTGTKREINEGRWAEVYFKGGQAVRFVNPELTDHNPINRHDVMNDKEFDLAFGSGIHETKYQQFKDILSVKPSDLSPLHSRKEFAREYVLLAIKGIWFEHSGAVPEIFSFETNQYRGFAISGLDHGWQNVGLHFFEKAQDRSYFVALEADARSGVRLSQPEVNRAIQTFTLVR